MENKDKHGLAINILKFQYYNFEFFNCQEIVLYETLMVLGGIHFAKKDEFYHSTESLVNKTGIKKHTVNETMIRFKQLGILDYQIKGMPKVKYIKILWENILEILPEIYQFDKVKEYFGGSTKPLIDFYQLLAENNEKIAENTEEKNNIKNSTEEYKEELKKEIVENALAKDEEIAIKDFKVFIEEIFQHKDTPRKSFSESDLLQAIRHYDIKEIQEFVEYRNNYLNTLDMRKFFEFSESGRMNDLEDYFRSKDQDVKRFIETLKEIFLERIEIYNECNKDYKQLTPLPVKNIVFEKMHLALKVKEEIEIKNAFIAFADDILYQRVKPTYDALSYFLAEEDGEYNVLDNYQLYFIERYSSK